MALSPSDLTKLWFVTKSVKEDDNLRNMVGRLTIGPSNVQFNTAGTDIDSLSLLDFTSNTQSINTFIVGIKPLSDSSKCWVVNQDNSD
jgi:hypothetical protein